MKFIDKLKNIFFEEVDEDEDTKEEVPKSFAKKVDIPKRKINFLKNDKEEDIKEKDSDKSSVKDEKTEEKKEENSDSNETFIEVSDEQENSKVIPMMYDVDDFQEDSDDYEDKNILTNDNLYKRENYYSESNHSRELYSGLNSDLYKESGNSSNNQIYSYSKNTFREEKQTKIFKPSPIISPIYGILDKNYRKEEVITKRETRISSSHSKPDLDSVRNKAFKDVEKKNISVKNTENDMNVESQKRKVYDVNNAKPHVNKVTLADAEEYYNDLGLAYNVDYSDASRNNETRTSKYSNREKKKEKQDTDDNLFDLIDSMYNKED